MTGITFLDAYESLLEGFATVLTYFGSTGLLVVLRRPLVRFFFKKGWEKAKGYLKETITDEILPLKSQVNSNYEENTYRWEMVLKIVQENRESRQQDSFRKRIEVGISETCERVITENFLSNAEIINFIQGVSATINQELRALIIRDYKVNTDPIEKKLSFRLSKTLGKMNEKEFDCNIEKFSTIIIQKADTAYSSFCFELNKHIKLINGKRITAIENETLNFIEKWIGQIIQIYINNQKFEY